MKPPEGLRHWPEYKYLFAWLKVATKGLSDESRARIREEIADHFHQAIAEGLRAGLSEDAAAQQAVAGLGSAKTARRAFRRTYLTRWQAAIVRSFVGEREPATSSGLLSAARNAERGWRGRWRVRLFLSIYLVLAVAAMKALQSQRLSPRESQLLIGIVALMVVAALVLAFVRRIFRSGHERVAIALGSLAELVLWVGFIIAPSIGPLGRATDTLGLRLWLIGLLSIGWVAGHVPLLLKLGSRPEST